MKKEELAIVKENLIKEKKRLVEHIADLKELTKPISPENAIGRVSRMDAINNKSVNDAALLSSETKLKTINFALEKIDEPNFGNCRKCRNPIPYGRLIVMPGSSTCVKCASY